MQGLRGVADAHLTATHKAALGGQAEREALQCRDRDDAADGQRPADRPEGDDLLDLVADSDQRVFEVLWGDIPSGCTGLHDLAQPTVGKSHYNPTPNGSEKRTSPSTMSRMSGMPLRNCRVRSRPQPNAKPE